MSSTPPQSPLSEAPDDETRAALEDPRRRLGRHAIVAELGRGGMGVVYRGWDPALRRAVAIKVIGGSGIDARSVERFVREARAAARLRHPGIVAVHEVGMHEARPYIVMDFVEGRALDDLLAGLSPRRAAEIVREVALALDHAHRQGILHRDVKPHNVIVDGEGQPHLTDFGLARQTDSQDASLTATGQLLGTPHYVSPEQARGGDGSDVGPATDIYSLGAVLYEALTGRPPFTGTTVLAILHQLFQRDPEPPRTIAPALHRDLETITLRCLAKEPAARYGSAGELAADLRRFLDGEPIAARPVGRRERLARWARRNRAFAATLAIATVLIATLLAAGSAFAVYSFAEIAAALEDARAERDAARTARAEAEAARAREAGESRRAREAEGRAVGAEARARDEAAEARRHLGRALREKGERLLEQRRAGAAWVCLARALATDDDPTTRGRLDEARGRSPRLRWSTPHALEWPILAIGFTPEGGLVAWTDHFVNRFDASLRALVRTRLGGVAGAVSALAPDGGRVATTGTRMGYDGVLDHAIDIRDLARPDATVRLRGHADRVVDLAWSADGRRLASASADGTARVWDTAAGEALAVVDLEAPLGAVALAPDGTWLAAGIAGPPGRVVIRDLAAPETDRARFDHAGDAPLTALAVAGARVAAADAAGAVAVRDAETGGVTRLGGARPGGIAALAFTRDGAVLASAGAADGRLVLHDLAAGTERSVPIASEIGRGELAVEPGGRRIAVAGPSAYGVMIVDAHRGEVVARLDGHRGYVISSLALSRDGKAVASADGHGGIRIWNAETGALAASLPAKGQLIAWGAGATLLVASDLAPAFSIWDLTDLDAPVERRRVEGGWDGGIRALATSGDGAVVAVAFIDRARPATPSVVSIDVVDVAAGSRLLRLPEERSNVRIAISTDGRRLAIGGDAPPKVIALPGGAEVPTGVTERCQRVALSDDGRRLAVVTDPRVRVVNLDTAKETASWRPRFGATALAFAPGPGQTSLLVGDTEGEVSVRRFVFGAIVATSMPGSGVAPNAVAWSPDGASAFVAAGASIRRWSLPGDRGTDTRITTTIGRLAWTPDGAAVLTVVGDAVKLVEIDGRRTRLEIAHPGARDAALDRNGEVLLTAGDGTIRVWDARSGAPLGAFEPGTRASTIATDAAARVIAVTELQGDLSLWRRTGERLGAIERRRAGYLPDVAVSPDGATIAVGWPGEVALLTVDGRPLGLLAHPGADRPRVAFSDDGARLAAAGGRTVRVWDLASREPTATLASPTPLLDQIAWSPDGRLLAAPAHDDLVHVWDAANGRELLAITGLPPTGRLAFAPDGERIAAVRNRSRVHLHDLAILDASPAELVEDATAATGLDLVGIDLVPRPLNRFVRTGTR